MYTPTGRKVRLFTAAAQTVLLRRAVPQLAFVVKTANRPLPLCVLPLPRLTSPHQSSTVHQMWIDPTTLVARAAAVTSSLTLHRQATAAALASSFSLTRVWTSNQPTTRDLPFNTTSTVQWLLDYWSLERKVSTTDIEFVEDPFSGSVAVGDPLVLKVDYPAGEKGGVQFW